MTKTPSRGVLALRLGLASSLLVGVCALFAGACGAAAETTLHFGGESHFLRHCSETCSDGLDCISGVCTRGCVVGQQNSCAAFAGALCTSDSFEPGAVAVCDVKCSVDADCGALGGDYACDAGFCRAPELGVASGGSAGAGGTAAGEAGSSGLAGSGGTSGAGGTAEGADGGMAVDCEAYRNRAGATELAVVIRNERSTAVYVQPFQECNDGSLTRVNLERDGQAVNIRGFVECGRNTCEYIQDNGFQEPVPCPDSCQQSPLLIRLDPGAEFDGGQAWTEFVSHGILGSTGRMPDACVPGQKDPQYGPGTQCFAQIPLPSGTYRITARAFLSPQCGEDGACDCTATSGSCFTGTTQGVGAAITATADVQVPASTVTVTFRDE